MFTALYYNYMRDKCVYTTYKMLCVAARRCGCAFGSRNNVGIYCVVRATRRMARDIFALNLSLWTGFANELLEDDARRLRIARATTYCVRVCVCLTRRCGREEDPT